MRNISKVVLLTVAGAGLATGAQAGTNTGSFTVGATVNGACSVSGTTMNFANYDGSADATVDGTITAHCTGGTAYTIALNAGSTASVTAGATVTLRKLLNGTRALNYTLSQADGTTNWGTAVGQMATGTGNNADQTFTVKGKIAAGQSTFSGSYADTITATISF